MMPDMFVFVLDLRSRSQPCAATWNMQGNCHWSNQCTVLPFCMKIDPKIGHAVSKNYLNRPDSLSVIQILPFLVCQQLWQGQCLGDFFFLAELRNLNYNVVLSTRTRGDSNRHKPVFELLISNYGIFSMHWNYLPSWHHISCVESV